ncbi:MAG: hypothetical protein K6E47_06225 [Lachnospiraceae bacterium]|nr:hypothetical protein [Lachnospiraceae bacterium]
MENENINTNQAAETVVTQAETPVAETVQKPEAVQKPAAESGKGKQKKSHKGLKIALIVILAIIVLAGAFFAYVYSTQKEYVLNKWALMTKDDTGYFRYVMDRNIEKVENSFVEHKEKAGNVEIPEEWTANGSLKVTLDATLGRLFLAQSFAGFKDVGAKYTVSVDKNKNLSLYLIPFYKNVDLLEVAGMANIKDRKIYASIPSYRKEVVDLSAVLDQYSEQIDAIEKKFGDNIDPDKLKQQFETLKNKFDKDEIDRLIHIAYDKVESAELAKDVKVTVNGMEKELNVLSCKLSKQECIDLVKAYVNELEINILTLIPDLSGMDLSGIEGLDKINVSDLLNIKKKITELKDDLYKKMEEANLSADLSFYVDAKGDIQGGAIKVSYNETKVKIDCLKAVEKENENKAQYGIDVTLNGMKLASIICNTEKSDGKCTFDATVKPGAMIEAVVKGGSSYVLTAKGSFTDMSSGTSEIDLEAVLNGSDGELASIYLKNSFSSGHKDLLDTSEDNVIDIMELPDSDYIDLGALLKPILDNVDKINDEGLNNFLAEFMQNTLGLKQMDVPGLKTMVNSGLISAGNSVVKDRLRKFLGIEPPYDYSSLSEKAKENEGIYLYSWDNLKDVPLTAAAGNLTFKVYDYFDRPDEFNPDIEDEKVKFLAQHADRSFERPAEDGEFIEMGDKIVFDVAPLIGSSVIDSYTYYDQKTTLGNYDYGAGIDDKLVGIKKGQTIDLELTLDDRFGAFAGYTGTFRITVKDITKVKMPEWTEEFIVGQLGYESVEALEQELIDKAREEYESQTEQYKPESEDIMAKLMDAVVLTVDLNACDSEALEAARTYDKAFKSSYGSALMDILKAAGLPMDSISKIMGTDTRIDEYGVRRRIVDAVVAYNFDLTVSQAEYDNFMSVMANNLGYSESAAFIEAVENKYGKRLFVDTIIDIKVQQKLYSMAEIDWE